jgi:hypothetical protein
MQNHTSKPIAEINQDSIQAQIIELVRKMTPESGKALVELLNAIAGVNHAEGVKPSVTVSQIQIDATGELQDVRAILDAIMNLRTETLADGNTARILAGMAYDKVLMIQGDAA